MLRNVLGFVAGFLVAGTIVGIIQAIGHQVYPPPPGMNPNDPESIKAYMDQIPTGALLFVLGAWILGTLGGTFVATLVAQQAPRMAAAAVAGMMLLSSVHMMVAIPSPGWFWAGALVGVPFAASIPILRASQKRPLETAEASEST